MPLSAAQVMFAQSGNVNSANASMLGRGTRQVQTETMPTKCSKKQTLDSSAYVRFSNRPFKVKRFQTIHRTSVDVARGLVLLFGIGTNLPTPPNEPKNGTHSD